MLHVHIMKCLCLYNRYWQIVVQVLFVNKFFKSLEYMLQKKRKHFDTQREETIKKIWKIAVLSRIVALDCCLQSCLWKRVKFQYTHLESSASITWRVVFLLNNSTMLICHLQLQEEELGDAFLLVFANKQDLPNALSVSEITDKLGLHNIKSRQVRNVRFGQHESYTVLVTWIYI